MQDILQDFFSHLREMLQDISILQEMLQDISILWEMFTGNFYFTGNVTGN